MSNPPKWADRFLRWYCNPDLLEEIQGDAHELYFRRVEEEGRPKAARKFIWDVLRFLKWSNIKRTKNQYYANNNMAMLKNYFITGLRNLIKSRTTSFINIFGLSLAIGCAITIFIFIDFQYNLDTFHKNRKNIYQVLNKIGDGQKEELWGDSPILLGPALTNHSSVDNMVRMECTNGSFGYGDKVFNESICFADPTFFEVFDFPILKGDRRALYEKNQVVISTHMALKYFGDKEPVGESITIKYTTGILASFIVAAVGDEIPMNASFGYDILIPFENFKDVHGTNEYDWNRLTDATFVSLHSDAQPDGLIGEMAPYMKLRNESNTKLPILGFEMIPLEEISLKSHLIVSSISKGGHPAGRIALVVIAVLILVLACFNYMNISVVSASRRLKEIGLRKVMGGTRREVISQFLIENLLLCFFAVILGSALAYFFFMRGFNSLLPVTIPFAFSSIVTLLTFFFSLLAVIGLASGAYPAFYIAKFKPVAIFRGNQKLGNRNLFSKVLLTFQFFLAITSIIGCFLFTDNALYLAEKDWGYDQNGLMTIQVSDKAQFVVLRNKSLENPKIKEIAGAITHIGRWDPISSIEHKNEQIKSVVHRVGFNYLETMNIRLSQGRFFDEKHPSDQQNAVVINRSLAQRLKWSDPLNQTLEYDSVRYQVIGVIEDFYHESFYNEVMPMLFVMADPDRFRYIALQTTTGDLRDVNESLKASWKDISPNDPYSGIYQTDVFGQFFEENEANIGIIGFVSVLTLILACIGLFGLVSFNIQKRMKEFSVRKVMGASVSNIAKLINADYVWVLSIAFVAGIPLSIYMMSQLMEAIYADPKTVDILPIIIAVVIIVVTVFLTISSQVFNVSKDNPIDRLKE